MLVYRRQHGGREWVRLRTWNKHRHKHVWYPTKRFFTIPIDCARELGGAIAEATGGRPFGHLRGGSGMELRR